MKRVELYVPDEKGTREAGRRLAEQLRPGDVVCLYGGLGAGKTTFTKGLASFLGIPEREIASASFTIIAEHEGSIPLYHVDLYRLDEGSVWETGVEEYFGMGGITVVEWSERGEDIMPAERINVRISMEGEGRHITIESADTLDFGGLFRESP